MRCKAHREPARPRRRKSVTVETCVRRAIAKRLDQLDDFHSYAYSPENVVKFGPVHSEIMCLNKISKKEREETVSYTHLTLPTILRV